MIVNSSTPEFRQEMGFLNQSGMQTLTTGTQYIKQLGKDSLWRPTLDLSVKEEFDEDGFLRLSHSHNFSIKGLHRVSGVVGWMSEEYQGDTVSGLYGTGSWEARINRRLNTGLQYDYATSLDYATGLMAQNQQIAFEWLWRPQSNLRLDVDLAQQWYQLTNAEKQSIQRIYSRLNWQYSQYLGTRVIAQTVHSNQDAERSLDSLFGSFLLSYIRNPGNEIYIGATWNWTPDPDAIPNQPNTFPTDDLLLQQQMLFAKWTHLFQY